METSLHRQLKDHYAANGARFEVPVDGYRIDVVNGKRLVEIQHGSLSAIRDKVRKLVKKHDVDVIKPIIARKQLVKRKRRGGRVASRRWSPKRGTILDLFDELVYFTRAFPHRRLTLHVPLVEVEEWRYPGHGRRRRRRPGDFQVEDRILVDVVAEHQFATCNDLCALLPDELPRPFHTGHLADGLEIDRWVAQRIAYTLREMSAVKVVGKQGNALLYEMASSKAAA